jgi:hypothetical protein
MVGYDTGDFGPENSLTRAEVAMIFYRLLADKNVAVTRHFADVEDGWWYAQAINVLASLDVVRGYDNGLYGPSDPVTRAEFIAIATRFSSLKQTGGSPFSDVKESDWFYTSVAVASESGLVYGYGDGTFRPNEEIIRADAVVVLNRMLGRSGDRTYLSGKKSGLRSFNDLDISHTAYYDVMEATNDHSCRTGSDTERWSD